MRSSGRAKISPRKSRQDSAEIADYQTVLDRLCQEADVLISPIVQRLSSVSELLKKVIDKSDPILQLSNMEQPPDPGMCEAPAPPTIRLAYDWFGEYGESPVSVICKSFYLEYALVRAVFMSFSSFSTISCLKIEDCCIGRDVVKILATLLADPPGTNIIDLSLNGNPDIVCDVPLILKTDIKYLSLKRCNLDDKAAKLISRELGYSSERNGKLQMLNLSLNMIGDEGMRGLAAALRTNRTLKSLSLYGNQITDVGASYIAEVLGRFPLIHEEIKLRRRSMFDRLLQKKSILDKLLEEWKIKNEIDSQTKIKNSDWRPPGKRTKSLEGGAKRASTSSRDRKFNNSTRTSSREKVRGWRKSVGGPGETLRNFLEPTPSQMKDLMLQCDKEMIPDKHPFVSEVSPLENELWCDGCWSLGNLNLSYNRLTEHSAEKFLQAIYQQDESFNFPRRGLFRLVIQPGNKIPQDSVRVSEIECALTKRWSYKSNQEQKV